MEKKWIGAYKVVDLSSKQLALERDFELDKDIQNTLLLAGGEYNIIIFLDVGMTAAYANLTLLVNMDHASNIDRYWEIHTTELNLTEDYNPNEAERARNHEVRLEEFGVSEKFGREYLKLYLRSHSRETPLEEVGDSLRRLT